MTVGPTASLDVPGMLAALDRYPYGCAEQTVSRALPLVYANAVAQRMGLAHRQGDRASACEGAIERVFEMQDSLRRLRRLGPVRSATCG